MRAAMGRQGTAMAGLLALALAGCASAPGPDSLTWDPHEPFNRRAHAVNVAIDRSAWGPAARGYGRAVPAPVRRGIGNLRDHWRLPHHVIQYALQGRGELAAQSTVRFAVNTVVGVGGLFDPATAAGAPYRETGFDETFHVWGIGEGGYLELPVGGPGTERDWTGWVLDLAADPMTWLLPVEATQALVGVAALDLADERYRLDPVLESLLHDSADSYTALRLSYLQNMRARLREETDLELLEDVYGF